jgi:hypothetical protein
MENNEPEKIQEAKVSEPEKISEPAVSKVKKRRRDFLVELVLFFILGILIGVAVKTEALERITMGYEDYKMKIGRQDYNINQIQKDLTAESMAAQENQATEEMPMENVPEQNAPEQNAPEQDAQKDEGQEPQAE